jgi:membrane fusion protein (multidrug efflux system)
MFMAYFKSVSNIIVALGMLAGLVISVPRFVSLQTTKHPAEEASKTSHVVTGHTESTEHSGTEPGDAAHAGGQHHAIHKILATSPVVQNVTVTRPYVAQIHSRRHIELAALEGGYLKSIGVNEGQAVKEGESMFKILPVLYNARLSADVAELNKAQVEYDNTRSLAEKNIVSQQELKVAAANLDHAKAKFDLAKAEATFAEIKAPFDGIIDRLRKREGSLIEEGEVLTTLSDNQVMWVYFNVPEARYLEYQTDKLAESGNVQISLKLANHQIFDHTGKIGAIEADFDNTTGNISFRADFPNPDGLLRHGQTGTVMIQSVKKNSIVIPQRATFEILAKKYVYVIDDQSAVHQREIHIGDEQDDIYLIDSGVKPGEKIVLEGILQVRDGQKIDFEFRDPTHVLSHLKLHAE